MSLLLLLAGASEYPTGLAAVSSELQTLAPSAIITLFEIDATALGDTLYRFHSGTNGLLGGVVWQGQTYSPFPIEASGFELTGKGTLPRPKVRVSNVLGTMSALVLLYDDLAGVKFTRIRTLAKFLDRVNFPSGVNPTADPTAEYPRDIYFIDRKSEENNEYVEFELAAALDLAGVRLPRRQIVQNYCPWKYRGTECGYTGTNYFDTNDASVGSLALDVCGKRLSSCRARFGSTTELPYGGFPAVGLVKQ
jgi:lambda family phage minor tail protein L